MSKIFDYEIVLGETSSQLGSTFTSHDNSVNDAKKGYNGGLAMSDSSKIATPIRLLFNEKPLNKDDVTAEDKNLTNTPAVINVTGVDFITASGEATLAAAKTAVFGDADSVDPLDLGDASFSIDRKFLTNIMTGGNLEFAIILQDRTAYTFDVKGSGNVSNIKAVGHGVMGPSERQGRLAGRF